MKIATIIISIVSLGVILVSALLVFAGQMPHDSFVTWTIVATLAWFITSPFWLAAKKGTTN